MRKNKLKNSVKFCTFVFVCTFIKAKTFNDFKALILAIIFKVCYLCRQRYYKPTSFCSSVLTRAIIIACMNLSEIKLYHDGLNKLSI